MDRFDCVHCPLRSFYRFRGRHAERSFGRSCCRGPDKRRQGHYTKAAIFAGAAVVTGVGLVLSQVHYNQAVERFNGLRETYVGYEGNLQEGTVVPYSEITGTYSDMQDAYDDSETRETWRNTFMVAFIVTYAANLVDVILSEPDTGERQREAPVGMELPRQRHSPLWNASLLDLDRLLVKRTIVILDCLQ